MAIKDKRSLLFYVIDDDPDVGALIAALLEADGHTVAVSNDSNKAISEIPNIAPDAVILDMMMPGIDGLGVIETLKPETSLAHTKFLVVSSKAYEWDKRAAFDRGADGYVTNRFAWPAD